MAVAVFPWSYDHDLDAWGSASDYIIQFHRQVTKSMEKVAGSYSHGRSYNDLHSPCLIMVTVTVKLLSLRAQSHSFLDYKCIT